MSDYSTNKKVIALIPARSGSKGVPDKNIRVLGNRTLIEHACDWCADQEWIDDFYISTDSQKYADMAINAGANFLALREDILSSDTASSASVAVDFLKKLVPVEMLSKTWLVLVQPTSPVRPHFDLETITEHLHENGSAVTVSRINEPHPYKLKVIDDGALNSIFLGANSEVSRQLLPEVYQLTGSLYIINGKILVKNKKMLVDPCRPIFQEVFFNIDTEKDFKIAEHMCFK